MTYLPRGAFGGVTPAEILSFACVAQALLHGVDSTGELVISAMKEANPRTRLRGAIGADVSKWGKTRGEFP